MFRVGCCRPSGEMSQPHFFFQKRIALHGGVAATLTPIALQCATKQCTQGTFQEHPGQDQASTGQTRHIHCKGQSQLNAWGVQPKFLMLVGVFLLGIRVPQKGYRQKEFERFFFCGG